MAGINFISTNTTVIISPTTVAICPEAGGSVLMRDYVPLLAAQQRAIGHGTKGPVRSPEKPECGLRAVSTGGEESAPALFVREGTPL